MLAELRRLFEHAAWADAEVLTALDASSHAVDAAWREYNHVLGTAELWLARLEQRSPVVDVWPNLTPAEAQRARAALLSGYAAYCAKLAEADLDQLIPYTNSAGQSFRTSIKDILIHAALHGQYHRGKINLLLRQAGYAPAPVDFIAFVRGVPAATEVDGRGLD